VASENSTVCLATEGSVAPSAGPSPTSVVIRLEVLSAVIAEELGLADKVTVK
jgi:hypothetical protein